MTMRVISDLQSEGDLDSVRNSYDVSIYKGMPSTETVTSIINYQLTGTASY